MKMILIQASERIGDPILGWIIPAVVLLISIVSTWILYKKFSK